MVSAISSNKSIFSVIIIVITIILLSEVRKMYKWTEICSFGNQYSYYAGNTE